MGRPLVRDRPRSGVTRRPQRQFRTGGGRELAGGRVQGTAALISVWILCLAPVAVMPGLYNRWGWPVLLAVCVAALAAMWGPSAGHLPGCMWAVGIALIGVFCLSALLGSSPVAQLMGRAPRYEGLVSLPAFVCALWLGSRLFGPGIQTRVARHATRATSLSSILLGGLAALEAAGLRPLETDAARPGSLAGNATDQGLLGVLFLGVLIPISVEKWRNDRRSASWAVVGCCFAAVSVATSASRAAYIALLVLAVVLASQFLRSSRHRRRDALRVILAVFAVVALALATPMTRHRFFSGSVLASQTFSDRLVIWKDAIQVWSKSPVLGVGPSGYMDAVPSTFDDEWYHRAEIGSILDSPHNAVLQVAVAGGWIGVAVACAFAAVIVSAAVNSLRAAQGPRRALLVGVCGAVFAVVGALLTTSTSPKTVMPVAVLVGLVASQRMDRPVGEGMDESSWSPLRQRWRPLKWLGRAARFGVRAALGLSIVFLVVCSVADAELLKATRAASDGRTTEAQEGFRLAAALRPWDADIPLQAAEALGGALDEGFEAASDDADQWAQIAVERLPDSVRSHQALGMIAQARGDYAIAVSELGRASALSPADPRLHHELGVALGASGQLEAARVELERASKLEPDSMATWNALEWVCEQQQDSECVNDARAKTTGE